MEKAEQKKFEGNLWLHDFWEKLKIVKEINLIEP